MTDRAALESIAIQSAQFFEAATRNGLPDRINSTPELAPLKSSLSRLGGMLMKWGLVTKSNGIFTSVPAAAAKLNDAAARDISAVIAETAKPTTLSVIRLLGSDSGDMLNALEKMRGLLDEPASAQRRETTSNQAGLFRTERFITRNMLRESPDTLFVFGDNLARQGLGGQAKEMRGEKNAVGIPTKRAPRRDESAYFTDADFDTAIKSMEKDMARLKTHIMAGGDIVFPTDGIGSGLAELSRRAPKIDTYIKARIGEVRALSRDAAPVRSGAETPVAQPVPSIEVFNKKSLPRGALPGDILDISRYGTLRFGGDTKPTLGNPFVMNEYRGHDGSREDVVRKYASKLAADFERPGFRDWFAGVTDGKKGVACFCAPDLCHGFVTKAAIEALRAGRDPLEAIRPFQSDPVAARAAQERQAKQDITADDRRNEERVTPDPARQRPRQSGLSR